MSIFRALCPEHAFSQFAFPSPHEYPQLKEVSIEATRITALPYFIFCPRHVILVTLAQFNEAAVGYAISLTRDPRRKARGCLKRDVLIDP